MIPALRRLSALLHTADAQSAPGTDIRLAVAVLLLEVAKRDGEFSQNEQAAIERLVAERLSLGEAERTSLLAAASEVSADLVQLHPFTTAIASQLAVDERIAVIEMLWEVAYADGVLDPEEDALIRRLGNLLHIEDRDRVLARMRALDRTRGRTP